MFPSRGVAGIVFAVLLQSLSLSAQIGPRFEITVPADVHAQPITGRVYVIISRTGGTDLRDQIGLFDDFVRQMGSGVAAHAPAGVDTKSWQY